MIQFIKYIIAFILFISPFLSFSQEDYFSRDMSKKYAEYLFNNREYHLALQEYERVYFMDSTDLISLDYLLQSAKFDKDYKRGIRALMNKNIANYNLDIRKNYYSLLFLNRDIEQLDLFLENEISHHEITRMKFSTAILKREWDRAEQYLQEYKQSDKIEMTLLLNKCKASKLKSPYLAGALSAVIPGLGKVYTGYWKDAIFSILLTGSSAYQAYRGFSKKGTGNVYAWIYSGISCGFYIGNIYGSQKSAKTRNFKVLNQFDEEVDAIYYD